MRVSTLLFSTLAAAGLAATGCTCGPGGCTQPAYNAPPAQQMMHPGPGVGGPGPGVLPVGGQMTMGGAGMGPTFGPGGNSASGIEQCQYCPDGGAGAGGGMGMMGAASQIAFVGEDGLQVSWDVSGSGLFDSSPLVVPGRQDFRQGAIYRLKLTNIPGREAISLYPTLEVAPVTPRTDAYLAHAPIPVQFTEEDFDQVISGNFVTKVIYLPDPEFQELALAGVETLVSTRLDPGCDPVAEADRRGSILAIVRIGNKDLENANRYMGGVTPADYAGCEPGAAGAAGAGGPMPMGMPTAGMAPAPMPPHMMNAMAGQYGMPITGTPIGIPGPPHIPLGVPAGLRKHTVTNRTRVHLPPPTHEFNISVKQRPGINYPAPVNCMTVDETNRAPLKCIGGTVPCPITQMSCSGEDDCQCEGCLGYCEDGGCYTE
ncbi:hypothetical protein KOR34_36700 [Posidoniimonas corsicana]|uniref:Uncharacterized protein n=1 Tax=Posidoniimonas corsicana TaxID=1938618 RepID=A0A5C5V5M6_9BACT|nr:hypothetical protein [Posidoniimonas corsicana]TWT33836.1 hypothetical protein KOR34_36700 [Posidoniimonas corsicana]